MPRDLTERDECIALTRYLQRAQVLFFHPPNEGRRPKKTAMGLRYSGMSPGVPDFLIFEPGPWGNGIAVEMKRAIRPSKVSAAQKRWLQELRRRGWAANVCNGFKSALSYFEDIGFRAWLAAQGRDVETSPPPPWREK